MSPPLLEAHLSAAGRISRLAVGTALVPTQTVYRVPEDTTQDYHVEGLPFGTRGGLLVRHQFPATGEYAHYFLPDMDAATGDLPALQALASELGVVFMKSPLPSGSYTVDHTASVVLIDPQGRLAGLIRPPFDAARIAADLRTLSK